jgi:putative PIN family toxin of toxin-antitoxin system
MTPRVVLDTNVVVSAVLDQRSLGRPSLCVRLVLAGRLKLIVSDELLAEYQEVLTRPEFDLDPKQVREFLSKLAAGAESVRPDDLPEDAVKDPRDLSVLATATAGAADYLVTGNRKDFPATYRDIVILKPAEFLEAVRYAI